MKQVMSHNSNPSAVIIAIDPGAAGGIAIHAEGKVSASKLDEQESFELIRGYLPSDGTSPEDIMCYMEQVGGYIGKEQPGSMMFNFGNGYGYWRGVLKALDIPLTLVPPQKWQRAVAPGVARLDYNVRKRALKELAQSWFPDLDVTLALADALCLLRYAEGGNVGSPEQAKGRSRDSFGADAKAFKRYCKAIGQGVPKGQEFMQGLNWWVEQGRPAK